MTDFNKTTVQANESLILEAGRLARARSEIKQQRVRENDARDNIIEQLSELNAQVVTEEGEELLTISEQLRPGGIDWTIFMSDHPDLDYDAYRKEASTVVTVRTGPAALRVDISTEDIKDYSGKIIARHEQLHVPD